MDNEHLDFIIEGYQPCLLNAFAVVDTEGKQKKTGSAVMGDPDEWKVKTYTDAEGFVVVPFANLARCLSSAGAKVKASGRETYKTLIPACTYILPEMPRFLWDGKPFKLEDVEKRGWIDQRHVKLKGGGHQYRYRTKMPAGWRLAFQLMMTGEEVTVEGLINCMEVAGRRKGIGDYRPSSPSPGPYGTFKIVSCLYKGEEQVS